MLKGFPKISQWTCGWTGQNPQFAWSCPTAQFCLVSLCEHQSNMADLHQASFFSIQNPLNNIRDHFSSFHVDFLITRDLL